MKKVVLALAVVCSVALVSCSSKENKAADSDTVVATEAVCNDSAACCDSAAADSAAADTVVADSVKK
ncbi:MAG: entericidin [Muribaculaceae bacterium]|nr:entericidin [Muribaculaceae bacterium]MDE5957415.1 entericidin [Muribaculaceae bacterium]